MIKNHEWNKGEIPKPFMIFFVLKGLKVPYVRTEYNGGSERM